MAIVNWGGGRVPSELRVSTPRETIHEVHGEVFAHQIATSCSRGVVHRLILCRRMWQIAGAWVPLASVAKVRANPNSSRKFFFAAVRDDVVVIEPEIYPRRGR